MSLCLIIDGLLMAGDPPIRERCPEIFRLAAMGQGGVVDWGPGWESLESGERFNRFLSPGSKERDGINLPVGYLTALGLGLDPDPGRCWGVLDLLHLFQKVDKLLFLSPDRLALKTAQKRALIADLKEEFALQGWEIHWSESWGIAVVSTRESHSVEITATAVLEGASFADHLPRGRDAAKLIGILTTGQMVLARASVNRQRERDGLLPLNSPWLWGIGSAEEYVRAVRQENPLEGGNSWSGDPLFAGLARGQGVDALHLDEEALHTAPLEQMVTAALRGHCVVHLSSPARLARLGRFAERQAWLQAMEEAFFVPLLEGLSRAGGRLLLTTFALRDEEGKPMAGAVPWLRVQGAELKRKKGFWHRKQLGKGASISVQQFRKEWLR